MQKMTSQEFVDRWTDSGTSAAVKMKQQIDDMIAAAYERGKADGAKEERNAISQRGTTHNS
jgi:hypothetical protein